LLWIYLQPTFVEQKNLATSQQQLREGNSSSKIRKKTELGRQILKQSISPEKETLTNCL
jgi:hypothetical protein